MLPLKQGFKPENTTVVITNESSSMKSHNIGSKPVDVNRKRPMYGDTSSISNDSPKKVKLNSHAGINYSSSALTNIKRTHVSQCCYSCGEGYGEMVSCATCSAIFHLLCIDPSSSEEETLNNFYSCENCRSVTNTNDESIHRNKQQKLISPFLFNPKAALQGNNSQKTQRCHSRLDRIKLPPASHNQSLTQSVDEIQLSTGDCNSTKSEQLFPSSNLKCKGLVSSVSSSPPTQNNVQIPNTTLNTLYHLFLSSQPEEFHSSSLVSSSSVPNDEHQNQKVSIASEKCCFVCRKHSTKQGPSIRCDYCPLTFHLDCLTPRMTMFPGPNEKWMCPNHIEPILDHYFYKDKTLSAHGRIKLFPPCPVVEPDIILQDFTDEKQSKNCILSSTINNHRMERIDISEIPACITEIYSKFNGKQNCNLEIATDDHTENEREETHRISTANSISYDPCVWDTLQAMVNHIVNNDTYEFSLVDNSSFETAHLASLTSTNECNTFDVLDKLLQTLNEPNSMVDRCKFSETNNGNSPRVITTNDDSVELQNAPKPLMNPLSLIINLSQFRLSRAALIHLQSRNVIYTSKHVIWFGSLPTNDVCLTSFNQSQPCQCISDRHACLIYDRKHNRFELLNYSEHGTMVNELCYGVGSSMDFEPIKQENGNLQECLCSRKSRFRPTWDGPAEIEQGTVIKMGCHEFLFYRHIVR